MSVDPTTAPAPPDAPRWRLPHPIVLLTAGVLIAATLTWVIAAGEFDRRQDPITGRMVVVAGTYHRVAPAPVGFFQALMAIPRGFTEAASVIATVFLAGAAFLVVERTGALHWAVDRLAALLRDRGALVIPVTSLVFATFGALENMQEEIIALVPVLVLLTRRFGYDAVVAVAISVGAAAIGASFSPINPFQVGIAQKLASLPALSAGGFRLAFLLLALAAWIVGTLRYARRTAPAAAVAQTPAGSASTAAASRGSRGLVLLLVVVTFLAYVIGVIELGWGFDELSALFLAMGLIAGLLGRLGLAGTAEAFVDGFRAMAYAALLIGFARGIYVVLEQGHIVDTIVNGLFTPLARLPVAMAAFGMMAVHTALHVPVPSVSGQAVLTMPVLVPLSDLLGISRQVTVLAYQYGAGLCELITPTNGALMAVLAASGVAYERWLRFVVPLYLVLFATGLLAVGVAMAINLP
ncbi:MAG: YfcC family protein [Gemmatimonadota bacterium]